MNLRFTKLIAVVLAVMLLSACTTTPPVSSSSSQSDQPPVSQDTSSTSTSPSSSSSASPEDIAKAITAAEFMGISKTREEKNMHPFAAATSNVTVNGEEVNINVFLRRQYEYPDYPEFMYVDVINRAIAYKTANPEETVTLNFAMYDMSLKTRFYYRTDDEKYGRLSGVDSEGRTETLCDSLARAAQNGLYVNCAIQANSQQENIKTKFNSLAELDCIEAGKKVSDYLKVSYVTWGTASAEQMHCKFISASHYLMDDGTVMKNAVFISTSNVDGVDAQGNFSSGQDRMQSAVLVSGSSGIYNAYCRYFSIISEYAENQEGFRTAVRDLHAKGELNYSDKYFSTYFTPIPTDPEDAWTPGYNPVVEYIEEMAASSGPRLFYANVYHYNTNPSYGFGIKVLSSIKDIANDGKGQLLAKWLIETNSAASKGYVSDTAFLRAVKETGAARYYTVDQKVKTHCKNYLFAYTKDGEMKYVSITGSTNLKWDGAYKKANSSIAIKEYGDYHPVFDCLTQQVDNAIQ